VLVTNVASHVVTSRQSVKGRTFGAASAAIIAATSQCAHPLAPASPVGSQIW